MIIKPSIRSNVFTNAHPLGSELFVKKQIEEAQAQEGFEGPKNVLIIGGSSGYGLASRIALAFGAGANTVNVSFESAPKGKRTGTAGWWNNIFFQKHAKDTGNIHKDFVGDAFSDAMKAQVSEYIKNHLGTVDLIVYSLAAGGRPDPETGELVRSAIKTIGEPATGKTIDIAKRKVKDLTVEPASDDEIRDTVFVMGGSDWKNWVERSDSDGVLAQGIKTISYTYVGGETTKRIYRGGTLGKAKEDLEEKARLMNKKLKADYEGEALISSSKAVVTKASVFIPQMPVYVSCLFDTMVEHAVHETILEHKYRLFKDMVYGDERIVDDAARIRIDHKEMRPQIQDKTSEMMEGISEEALLELDGTKMFFNEFYEMNGFGFEEIDYDEPVDMEALSQLKPE